MATAIFKIGCDPELMLTDESGNLKSAIPVVPGSKHKTYPVKNGSILADNVNLEFNTEPADSAAKFVSSIKTVIKQTVKIIGAEYKLVVRASADFPAAELKDPKALEFGCEPDFDAWSISVNKVEAGAAAKSFRSAGGHVHIGATDKTEFLYDDMGKLRMIRAMDAVAGVISVLIDHDETSIARRKLYGKAGCHRPKIYGVEYRSLGNFWVKSPELVKFVYNLTSIAVNLCVNNKDEALVESIGKDRIINCINNSDKQEALKIFNDNLKEVIGKKLCESTKKLMDTDFDFYSSWSL